MSNSELLRRVRIKIYFDGVDITDDINKYLLTLSFTDNEADEADDLQLTLCDKDDIWLQDWLNKAIWASVSSKHTASGATGEGTQVITRYKVIATSGVNVHSRPGEQYYLYGTLAYGTVIDVKTITNGWANITYSNKNAYVKSSALQAIHSSATSAATQNTSGWNVGDTVTATGIPHESSYGEGKNGVAVSNYEGTITYLNLRNNVPYPICVGNLGWFAENDVISLSGSASDVSYDNACKGMKIQAVIVRENWRGDGKDEVLDCGQFELDDVSASGPPNVITLKASSLPYTSTVRQTKKSRSWENYTLSGITTQIAAQNGMASMFLTAVDPFYSRVEQYKISDIAFLQKLCEEAGCSLKCTNNILVAFDKVMSATNTVNTFDRNKLPSSTKYKLNTGKSDTYSSCRVSYVNADGKLIEATAYIDGYDNDSKDNQRLEISRKVNSVYEALKLAERLLELYNRFEATASFNVPFTPDLLAGFGVKLINFGYWTGSYIIKQAKHSIGNSASTTQITLRKILSDMDGSELIGAVGDKTVSQLALEVIRGEWSAGDERRRLLMEAGYDYIAVQSEVNRVLKG